MDPQEFKHWRLFINLSLVLLIVLILSEVFIPETIEAELEMDNLLTLELILSLIILFDIAISFVKATDKIAFLKKNFIKIIAVFPWGFTFRAFALLRIEAEIPILAEALAVETEAVAAERVAGGAGRGFRIFAKLRELLEGL